MLQLPPLSLYIHIPWCVQKCPYCDFNSHALKQNVPETDYVAALLADLDADLGYVQNRQLQSIFIGGGTPSLFSANAIKDLLQGVAARIPFASDIEITLEANPGTVEAGRFAGYQQAGVTRISIGVQSFDDRFLKALGRVHNAEQAHAAVTEAAENFDTFNLDLMYALPGQTLADLDRDLDTALAFKPPHKPRSELTTIRPTLFTSRSIMNGCLYSGLACTK